jgi:hypothetical protein
MLKKLKTITLSTLLALGTATLGSTAPLLVLIIKGIIWEELIILIGK